MVNKIERLQITLTLEQTQALADMARKEGRSTVELVEKIVQAAIEQRRPERLAQQLESLERVRRHRAQILAAHHNQPLGVNIGVMLQEIRDERDDRLFHNTIHRH